MSTIPTGTTPQNITQDYLELFYEIIEIGTKKQDVVLHIQKSGEKADTEQQKKLRNMTDLVTVFPSEITSLFEIALKECSLSEIILLRREFEMKKTELSNDIRQWLHTILYKFYN